MSLPLDVPRRLPRPGSTPAYGGTLLRMIGTVPIRPHDHLLPVDRGRERLSELAAAAERLGELGVTVELRYGDDVLCLPEHELALAEVAAREGILDSLRRPAPPARIRVSMAVIGTEVGVVVRWPEPASSERRRRRRRDLRRIETALSARHGALDTFRDRSDVVLFASFPLDGCAVAVPTEVASAHA